MDTEEKISRPGQGDSKDVATEKQQENDNTAGSDSQPWKDDGGAGYSPLSSIVTPMQWCIDGVIPRDCITSIIAPAESFKTYIALDMGLHMATGKPWRGHQTTQSNVIYIAGEGGGGIMRRRAAIEQHLGEEIPAPMRIVNATPNLTTEAGVLEMVHIIDNTIPNTCTEQWYLPTNELDLCTQEELREYELADDREPIQRGKYLQTEQEIIGERLVDKYLHKMPKLVQVQNELYKKYSSSFRNSVTYHCPIEKRKTYNEQYQTPLVVILDTFSKTGGGDDETAVSAYIRNLMRLSEWLNELNKSISFIIIDHTLKSDDGQYVGSHKKRDDVDAMFLVRRRDNLVTVKCLKQKDAPKPADIHLKMQITEIAGAYNADDTPMTNIYPVDGDDLHRVYKKTGGSGETTAGVILQILSGADDGIHLDDLKAQYSESSFNEKKKPDTIRRSFQRVIKELSEDNLITVSDDDIVIDSRTD